MAGEPLPLALIDLDYVDHNLGVILEAARVGHKALRLATKSVRAPAVIDHLVEASRGAIAGVMAYAVTEAALLVEGGHTDVLVAYPSVQASDVELLVALNAGGRAKVGIVVDCAEHLDCLEAVAAAKNVVVPVIIEVDLSLRLFGGLLHLGAYRSPLRSAAGVLALAREVRTRSHLQLDGVMGYEAQMAGVGENNPFTRALNPVKRLVKRLSLPMIRRRRHEVRATLVADGFALRVVNGGGTGSLTTTRHEDAVTEVTVGSGFLCSHLFDYYASLRGLLPAAWFALQVVRVSDPGFVTCHGGGLIASGEPGRDRLPLPHLPPGLRLTRFEGAGEVQTPLCGRGAYELRPGDPVFFRHAKAGELAEHFTEYLLVRGAKVVGRAPTYRGLGKDFL
ncbi:MAG: alanine racemase [Deltaproteobacteria bacterium]|nr:alanine racemase [Deltaproteobacteria bacterium]